MCCVRSRNLLDETGLAVKLDSGVIARDGESVASRKCDGKSDHAFKCAGEWNQIVLTDISDAQRALPNQCRQIRYRWNGGNTVNGNRRILQPTRFVTTNVGRAKRDKPR